MLLNGGEAWTLNDKLEKNIIDCYTRILKSSLGYSWKDRIRNENYMEVCQNLQIKYEQKIKDSTISKKTPKRNRL